MPVLEDCLYAGNEAADPSNARDSICTSCQIPGDVWGIMAVLKILLEEDVDMDGLLLAYASPPIGAKALPVRLRIHRIFMVQWSEDVIKADPFFGRSRVRFRVPPWVSNTIARDHLA